MGGDVRVVRLKPQRSVQISAIKEVKWKYLRTRSNKL